MFLSRTLFFSPIFVNEQKRQGKDKKTSSISCLMIPLRVPDFALRWHTKNSSSNSRSKSRPLQGMASRATVSLLPACRLHQRSLHVAHVVKSHCPMIRSSSQTQRRERETLLPRFFMLSSQKSRHAAANNRCSQRQKMLSIER